jgi:mono/diheme cytochrome c family protein
MKFVKIGAGLLLVLLIVIVAGYGYASYAMGQKMSRTIETHTVDFPVPWPLTAEEVTELREERMAQWRQEQRASREDLDEDALAALEEDFDPLAGVDLEAVAMERAVARGEHLIRARYGCAECHGKDFSGGVMVDDPAIGRVLGPNLTRGKGSVILDYTVADWDRIVRHGVTQQGTPTVMPSVDFLAMSDQELSDIIAYIGSLPPVDNEVPAVTYGPLGRVLIAAGQIPLSADLAEHFAEHEALPPEAEVNVDFGQHLAQVCVGCHGLNYVGGPIPGGPPDWPAASNLTPHEQGLAGWTYDEFVTVMRTGRRRDGSPLRAPMSEIAYFANNMTDTEMEAMFLFLQSLPPLAQNRQ